VENTISVDRGNMAKPDRVLLAVLGLSLLLNCGQYAYYALYHGVRTTYTRSEIDSQLLPRIGTRLNELHLVKSDGSKLDLRFDSRGLPVVVYVLSPTCKWCMLNRPNISSLVSQTQGKYQIIGLSSTSIGLQDYVTKNAPPFPVYYMDPAAPSPPISLTVTPRTLVFSPDGAFKRGWNGAYMGDAKTEIASFFDVTLPSGT
jgi:hypothetical protein